MRLDYKLAILKSGRYQFEIAHESGLSEGRLSRFIRGREQLRPGEEQRLRTNPRIRGRDCLCGLMAEKWRCPQELRSQGLRGNSHFSPRSQSGRRHIEWYSTVYRMMSSAIV